MKILLQLQQALGWILFSILLFIVLVVICCIIVDRFNIPDTPLAVTICITVFIVIPYFYIIWKLSH